MFEKMVRLFRLEYDEKLSNKLCLWTGHLFFSILFLFSLLFFRERILHFDTANYIFNVIYFEDFYYGPTREISIIPQILPLLAITAGASLKTVLILYSFSFILFYYLVYNLIVYLFKNAQAGLFLVLALCLCLRYKFFAPVGEVVLGITYIGLIVGWISKPKERFKKLPIWLDAVIGALLVSLIFTTHPFVFIATFIVLGFFIVFEKRWTDVALWLTILMALVMLAMRFMMIQDVEYDADRMSPLYNALEILPKFQEYYVWGRIVWYFDTELHLPLAFFVILLGILLWKKRILPVLYLLLAFLGLLCIIFLTYSYLGFENYLMIDGYMAHLGIVFALPMVYFALKSRRALAFVSIVALILFSLDRIQNKKVYYQEREAYLMNIIHSNSNDQERKILTHMDEFDWKKLWIPWGVGMETLLMTSVDNPSAAATIYYEHYGDVSKRLDDEQLFLGPHYAPFNFNGPSLNPRFFQLKEGKYKKVSLR